MRERAPRIALEREHDVSSIEDALEDEPREVSRLFRKLPRELWQRQFDSLEGVQRKYAGEDAEVLMQEKVKYLTGVLEARREGLEEYKANDATFFDTLSERELGVHLQELLESPEDFLGAGQTAKVKRLTISDEKTAAIKYLLTPTAKTLSAEGEHDMLAEVDTLTRIEFEEEKHKAGQRIHVPHPYFFYKNEKLQCYGMQEIKGMTLEQLLDPNMPNTVALADRRDAVWKALGERYAATEEQQALYEELVAFTEAMHEVCLHGDIKLANLMADEQGHLYLIDFGQSVDMNLMNDKSREQFENLQELEHAQITTCVRKLMQQISRSSVS